MSVISKCIILFCFKVFNNKSCRVIECKGPTNTRVYTVAVYFRGVRLASAMGHSIQQAEMNAAKRALELSHG